MVEPTPGTEATRVPHSSTGTTAPATSVRPFPASHCKLTVGGRWQGYQIDAPAANGRPNCFEATHVGRMEKVEITATLVNKRTAARRALWEQLRALPPEMKIVRCTESHEEEGWRYEVTEEPPVTTLREWLACHQAESSVPRQLLEQLAVVVSALHSIGVVHLNIRPENIFLIGDDQPMQIVLGGFGTASSYKQAGGFTGEADLFYAPPEAVDEAGARPGVGLCAWDWWSLGRVVQEIILGRHVMSMLFGCNVTLDPGLEVRERARLLLLEQEPPGMRAGAVEAMPTTLDPAVKIMLRGLLTSARDARWGSEAVNLWLVKEGVSSHYDAARNARFFTWKGRGRSLSEAAQYFRTEENWTDGERNLFELNNSESLAHFLSTVPEHAADWKRLQEIHAHVQSPEWEPISEGARLSVAAALAWLAFGPQPGALVVKGRRVDAAGMAELLGCGRDSGNFEIVRALMSPPCRSLVAAHDSAAGEVLAQLAALGGEALGRVLQQGWVDEGDTDALAYVLKLSLENEPVLRKRAERVRTMFATCQDPILTGLLSERNPSPCAQVLLIVTGENPRRYGYVTKVEHARHHLTGLQARYRQLGVALLWLRLEAMLRSGRPWSGNWRMFVIFWICLVAFGVLLVRDVTTTAWFSAGLVLLRMELGRRVRKLTGANDPAAVSWNWRDGPSRCPDDARRVLGGSQGELSVDGILAQLKENETAMAAVGPGTGKGAVVSSGSRNTLLPVFAVAALLSVAGLVRLLENFNPHIGSEALSIAWLDSGPGSPGQPGSPGGPGSAQEIAALLRTMPDLSPEMVEKVKSGEYEIIREGFGSTLNGPIKKWAFSPPAVVPPLPVESRAPATSAQRAFALVSGELLLRPYGKKGVTAMVVVRVPTRDGFGLMVYNGKSRKLVENDALTLREGLPENSWHRYQRYNVIYLGAPSQMDVNRETLLSRNGTVGDLLSIIR